MLKHNYIQNFFKFKCGEIYFTNNGNYCYVCLKCKKIFEKVHFYEEHNLNQHCFKFDSDSSSSQTENPDLVKTEYIDQDVLKEDSVIDINENDTSHRHSILRNSKDPFEFILTELFKVKDVKTLTQPTENTNLKKINHEVHCELNLEISQKKKCASQNLLKNEKQQVEDGKTQTNFKDSEKTINQTDSLSTESDTNNSIYETKSDCTLVAQSHQEDNKFNKHKNDSIRLETEGVLSCQNCMKNFNDKKEFKEHIDSNSNSTLCTVCNTSFVNICQHISNTHPEYHKDDKTENIQCKYCGKLFKKKLALKDHELLHENKDLNCKFCGKAFQEQSFLKNHMRIHTGERPYKCEMCPAAFSEKRNLKTHHVCKHTNDYNFPCTYKDCNKTFKTKQLRKYHISNMHIKERKHQCEQCGVDFVNAGHLNVHKKKHHLDYKDRPHKCQLCDKKFVVLWQLKDHQNTHTGEKPHKCDQCTKSFAKRSALREHKKLHTGKKNHICKLCGMAFAQSPGLSNHMKYH